jgi:CheY-like chemotaxis protein
MSATPTIYFIDDSATMREVIKIAFRRENINVVACHDAALALTEIEKTRPDIVITDVIMPDKDGYDVCQYIKSHPELNKTPVVLMSGVVNRAVAEKAFAVKADELLRKPFQPQDLIARVKHLLKPAAAPGTTAPAANAAAALSSIFSSAAPPRAAVPAAAPVAASTPQKAATLIADSPGVATSPASSRPASILPSSAPAPSPFAVVSQPAPMSPPSQGASMPAPAADFLETGASAAAKPGNGNEVAKLKIEILRLEGLIKKLQSELQAEREYARSLETHVRSLQEAAR